MKAPQIQTAIPKRQYQFGEFIAKVLGDIESADGIDYRYIMALVREGEASPVLYVVTVPDAAAPGAYVLRLIMSAREFDVTSGARWGQLDEFVEGAFEVVRQAMSLNDEQPMRLA